MTRVRLRLGAATTGFFLILVELGFAAYSAEWFLTLTPPHGKVLTTTFSDYPRWAALVPFALLLVACVLGGLVLYRITRGQSRWSWYVATVAPIAALRAACRPQLGVYGPKLRESGLPWANVLGVEHVALVYGLQLGLYLAIAAFVGATVLCVPGRRTTTAISVGSARP